MVFRNSCVAACAAVSWAVSAAPVGMDGSIGAEWAGASLVSAGFDSAAATGNFGTPGTNNHVTAYDIRMRRDSEWLYAAVSTQGGGDASAVMFSNLYFSLRYGAGTYGSSGSSIGFEVTNNRAFKPGGDGSYFNDTGADLIRSVSSTSDTLDVLEMAIHLSVFTDNALGVASYGLPGGETAAGIRLNLSQSFGYSVIGGDSYGDARLGFVDLPAAEVPEPASWALAGLALLGLAASRRRT